MNKLLYKYANFRFKKTMEANLCKILVISKRYDIIIISSFILVIDTVRGVAPCTQKTKLRTHRKSSKKILKKKISKFKEEKKSMNVYTIRGQ